MQLDRTSQSNMGDLLNEHTVWMRKLWLLKLLEQHKRQVRLINILTSGPEI